MKKLLSLKISKENLNTALRILSVGAKSHRKYAEVYSIAFKVETEGKVSVLVPGGEYIIDAETSGIGCFSINYKWFKKFLKDCKMKNLELRLESGRLTINNIVTVKVKQSNGNIDIPLSLSYSVGELARLNLTMLNEEVVDFWRLKPQIEDAESRIQDVVNGIYIKLAGYLPPNSTESKVKEMIRQIILGKSMC